jgi:tRNA-dihydrouridine synthase B
VEKGDTSVLPWKAGIRPLMLAPMQGLTNRVLRRLVIELACPDVVFTEFVRVRPGVKKSIKEADRREMSARQSDVPLVVQLIGRSREALITAAVAAGELGAEHININLGCPFGRMSSSSAGGALLKEPADLAAILEGLRRVVSGSLSVKLRSGYDDPRQVFSLLPLLEDCGIDFVVLHPRTVRQRYEGKADHAVTASLVEKCRLPVIANGDIFSVADFERIDGLTGAAGFMLGRGAIADPWLFERIRGRLPAVPTEEDRRKEVRHFLSALLEGYLQLFFGETQVLNKMKAVLCHIGDTALEPSIRKLKRSKNLDAFRRHLTELENG